MKKYAIRKICELPIAFSRGGKSPFELSLMSGFLLVNKSDSIVLIEQYLENHDYLLNWWQQWSENKRTNRGYYLRFGDKNIVGYADFGNNGIIKEVEYKTAFGACSEFILLEISSILKVKVTKEKFSNLKW
jgi:hypothetical protein